MTPGLVKMAEQLVLHEEMELSEELRGQLERISVSTVKRRMRHIKQDEPRLPRKKPTPRNARTRDIPMKRIAWDQSEPGHFEVDLVHHSGSVSEGQYVHTLQMVDVATGWSERVAVMGRSQLVMKDGFQRIFMRLPFQVIEYHPDNGSEFLNHPLLAFWKEAVPTADISRSRPYQKNDNRFVEQKNESLVRAYFGNDRLDTIDQIILMNKIYDKMWLFYNFFQPVLRLKEKTFVEIEGQPRQIKRKYDTPQTPFDRLCATHVLAPDLIEHLESIRLKTNPLQLRREIHALLDQLFNLPPKATGVIVDVRDTLLLPSDMLASSPEMIFLPDYSMTSSIA